MRVRLALIAGAIGAALVPVPAALVERVYSTGAFVIFQPVVTSASNVVGVALLDVVMAAVGLGWLVMVIREVTTHPRLIDAVGRVVLRTVTWAAVLYLLFLAAWGLNYRRVRLAAKLAPGVQPIDARLVRSVVGATVERINALYATAHAVTSTAAPPIVPQRSAFARAVREVGVSSAVVPGRPKRTLLDWYFRRAGVSGMTDPFFLETLVATDVLPFERPFVTAHEWSHLAGIANEGDANFVGWLACVHGAPADQYSGWLFLYQELIGSVPREERARIAAALGPGPQQDLRAARERYLRNVSPRVSAAGWRVYDSYLKANRVEEGAASYADVVRLVLGTRFEADWTPVLK